MALTKLTNKTAIRVPLGIINDLSQAYIFDTVAAFKASLIEFPDGKTIRLLDRVADFTKISGQSGTGNKIIPSTSVSQSIELQSGNYNSVAWGVASDLVTLDTVALQEMFDGVPDNVIVNLKGGSLFGQVTLSKSVTIESDFKRCTLLGANGGFITDGTVDYLKITGVNVLGDGNVGNIHSLIRQGSGVTVGTLIIDKNKTDECIIGISAGFESGRTIKQAFITNNTVLNTRGVDAGQGYGIHCANDRFQGSFGKILVKGNYIENAERHSIYLSRSGGYICTGNAIKDHRRDITTSVLRAAMAVSRCSDVVITNNHFESCKHGNISVAPAIVGGQTYDSVNINISNNVFRNPLVLAPVYIGYLDFDQGAIQNISVNNNSFQMLTNSLPVLELNLGLNISFTDNNILYRAVSSTFNCISFVPRGETAGTTTYSNYWTIKNNNFAFFGMSTTFNLFRFNIDSGVQTRLIDNIADGQTRVISSPVSLSNSVVWMMGQKPEADVGLTVQELDSPSQDKLVFELSNAADPNTLGFSPKYLYQEIFMPNYLGGSFWKGKNLTSTGWVQIG